MTTDLIKLGAELGYSAEPTAGGHIRFTHPSGALVHTASTPSDHRARANARSDLRRELRIRGVDIVVEVRKLPPRARKRPTPTPRPAPTPPAGSFHPTARHGRLAGTVDGRAAVLELRHGAEGTGRAP
jgi:hypothetical protein